MAMNLLCTSQMSQTDKNIVTNVSGSSEAGYQGAKRILERSSDVTALFCMNDITAIGAIRAIHECGYRIPDDISIISMDDIEIAQYVSPMLTTMHIPIEEMGKMTAKILIDRIRNGHTLPQNIDFPACGLLQIGDFFRKRLLFLI